MSALQPAPANRVAPDLGHAIETVDERDARVQAVIGAARGVSPADIESMSRALVHALGHEYISTSDLRAVVCPVVDALARGQLNAEESKALLLGVMRAIGGPHASPGTVAVYLDAVAHGRTPDDLSLLSVGLYAMGEALGPSLLGSGRYQQVVDAIQSSLVSFPHGVRQRLAQAFLDSLSAPVEHPYRKVHSSERDGSDNKAVLVRVTKALVGNPDWRKLEALLGQPATDPDKMKGGCYNLVKALGLGPEQAGLFTAILNLVADGACRHTPQALSGAVHGLCEALGGKLLDEASLCAFVDLAMVDPRCGTTQAGAIAVGIARALGGEKISADLRNRLFSEVLGAAGADPKRIQAAFLALISALSVEKLAADERQAVAVCIETSALSYSQKAAMLARLSRG